MTHDTEKQVLSDLEEIKRAVIGETRLGNEGLVRRVQKLENWRSSVNMRAAFYSGVGATIVFVVKAGIEYLRNKP